MRNLRNGPTYSLHKKYREYRTDGCAVSVVAGVCGGDRSQCIGVASCPFVSCRACRGGSARAVRRIFQLPKPREGALR